jgi:tRNA threonylcarbamoyladenosine biosynthesis protein TsaE
MVEPMERLGTVGIRVEDECGTERVARRLAACVRRGDVVGLSGPLGGGKTVLARAFVRALIRPDEEVPSPTFTLVQRYEGAGGAVGAISHFDLYRIEDSNEIWELGIEEAVTDGVVLIEWPERLGALRPADFLEVSLAPAVDGPETARELTITGHGGWRDRIASFRAGEDGKCDGRT